MSMDVAKHADSRFESNNFFSIDMYFLTMHTKKFQSCLQFLFIYRRIYQWKSQICNILLAVVGLK